MKTLPRRTKDEPMITDKLDDTLVLFTEPASDPPPRRRPTRHVAVIALLIVALMVAAGVGFFFYASAQSDTRNTMRAQFAEELEAADAQARKDRAEAVTTAVTQQRQRDAKLLKRVRTKARRDAKKAYAKGQSEGYSSGSAAGFSSGSAQGYASGSADGYEDGLTDGSDELVCSDDPDVTWLPPCFSDQQVQQGRELKERSGARSRAAAAAAPVGQAATGAPISSESVPIGWSGSTNDRLDVAVGEEPDDLQRLLADVGDAVRDQRRDDGEVAGADVAALLADRGHRPRRRRCRGSPRRCRCGSGGTRRARPRSRRRRCPSRR